MAKERDIYFFNTTPERSKVRAVIDGFFGEDLLAPNVFQHAGDEEPTFRVMVRLPGEISDQCDWLDDERRNRLRDPLVDVMERWIKVEFDDDTHGGTREYPTRLTVTTSDGQDPFACALADGLTKSLSRNLGGQIIKLDGE